MDNRMEAANGITSSTAQAQKGKDIETKEPTHQHLINDTIPCLYPKGLDNSIIGAINYTNNLQSPLGSNSFMPLTPTAYPLVPSPIPTDGKSKLQGMEIDSKKPTEDPLPASIQNLSKSHTILPTPPTNEPLTPHHIHSTNQTSIRSTSSHNTINAQDPLTSRIDNNLDPNVDPHSNIKTKYSSLSNISDLKASAKQSLSKDSIQNAKATPQPKQKEQPDKEVRLDEASIPTPTPNPIDIHHQAITTKLCSPILVGMGPNGTCTQHQSPTRREGPHNSNRRPLILGTNCDGRNATRNEQCDATPMDELPATHAREFGPSPVPLEPPCRSPKPFSPHAEPKPPTVSYPCKPSSPNSQLLSCPKPAAISTQHQSSHVLLGQNNTPTFEPNSQCNSSLNSPRTEPNPNSTHDPFESESKCDGRGGRRGRNSNRKNS
ncbi:hypothetical protein A4A49_59434, partial [Nicotiana attenuata]